MARLSKYDIAVLIERLPGNMPLSSYSLMTIYYQYLTRSELVDIYNRLVSDRNLNLSLIS